MVAKVSVPAGSLAEGAGLSSVDDLTEAHPLYKLRTWVDRKLVSIWLNDNVWICGHRYTSVQSGFSQSVGTRRVPHDAIVRAMVLQAIYSPRDVADLIKRLHTQWVCRWFIGYHRHSAIWSSEEFHTLSQELLESELYGDLFESLRELSEDAEMFADPSFRVDTFLLARWASYC